MDLPSICINIPNKLQGYKVIFSGLLVALLPLHNYSSLCLADKKTDCYKPQSTGNKTISLDVILSYIIFLLLHLYIQI